VVTHSGKDHVVGRLGSATYASPSLTREVGVLQLVLQTAILWIGVDAIGEAGRSRDNRPGCTQADGTSWNAWSIRRSASKTVASSGGQWLGVATCVAGGDGSVAHQNATSVPVGGALRVLDTGIAKDINLRRWVTLKRDQALLRLDGCERAV